MLNRHGFHPFRSELQQQHKLAVEELAAADASAPALQPVPTTSSAIEPREMKSSQANYYCSTSYYSQPSPAKTSVTPLPNYSPVSSPNQSSPVYHANLNFSIENCVIAELCKVGCAKEITKTSTY